MKNVDDIYPVTPMQELMLLHALANPLSDPLFNQLCFEIDHPIRTEEFRTAWQRIVDTHPALRTAFIWEDVPRPLQVVRGSVEIELSEYDWRGKSEQEQNRRYSALLDEDRKSGLDFRRAPLMRFRLVRLAEQSWRFVWTSHHLSVDRWCLGQIFSEFDRYYCAGRDTARADSSPHRSGFRAYVDWLSRQDPDEAYAYWSAALRGCTRHSRLVPAGATRSGRGAGDKASAELVLGQETTVALAEYAKRHGLTRSTLIHGAWSLALNRLLGMQDVVFGATVSGRPSDIPDVETIVGSFVNNVPVRVEMPARTTIDEWLSNIQRSRFEASRFEYLSPGDIQSCSQLGDNEPLFDVLLVWLANVVQTATLPMRPLSFNYATPYPLTISIIDRPDSIALRADANQACLFTPEQVLEELASAVKTLIGARGGTALESLPGFRPDADYQPGSGPPAAAPAPISRKRPGSVAADQSAGSGREELGIDVLDELLHTEWSSLLGRSDIPADADFFELGGTSLQAATLHTRLEGATRQSIPMLALFSTPTIKGMSHTLFKGDWPVRPDIINGLRISGARPPLFCIASPEVNTVGYSLLTRHLPDAQSVYVLQSPPIGDDVQQIDPSALPGIAALYIEAMRSVQPDGPYRMLGMCTGSHIALEMSRQLEEAREAVAFLGIVNTWAMYTVSRLYVLNRSLNVLRWYAKRLTGLLPTVARRSDSGTETVADQDAIVRKTVVTQATSVSGSGSAWIKDVGFAHKDPGRQKIRATATVFRQKHQQFWRVREFDLGWSRHVEQVEVIPIPGNDQYRIFREPDVLSLASAIRACLERCDKLRPETIATATSKGRH